MMARFEAALDEPPEHADGSEDSGVAEAVEEMAAVLTAGPWMLSLFLSSDASGGFRRLVDAALAPRQSEGEVAGNEERRCWAATHLLRRMAAASPHAARVLGDTFDLSSRLKALLDPIVSGGSEDDAEGGAPHCIDELALERWLLWAAVTRGVEPPPNAVDDAYGALRSALGNRATDGVAAPPAAVAPELLLELGLPPGLQEPEEAQDDGNAEAAVREWWSAAGAAARWKACADPPLAALLLHLASGRAVTALQAGAECEAYAAGGAACAATDRALLGHCFVPGSAQAVRLSQCVELVVEAELPQVAVAFARGGFGGSVAALATQWCSHGFCGALPRPAVSHALLSALLQGEGGSAAAALVWACVALLESLAPQLLRAVAEGRCLALAAVWGDADACGLQQLERVEALSRVYGQWAGLYLAGT